MSGIEQEALKGEGAVIIVTSFICNSSQVVLAFPGQTERAGVMEMKVQKQPQRPKKPAEWPGGSHGGQKWEREREDLLPVVTGPRRSEMLAQELWLGRSQLRVPAGPSQVSPLPTACLST